MSRAPMSCTERAQRELLPLELSLYHAARDYPGGATAIAAVFGRNPTTLQHKLSPTNTTHHLNPQDITEVVEVTRDPRIVDSVIEAYGDAAWVDLRGWLDAFGSGQSLGSILAGVGETLRTQSGLTDEVAKSLGNDGRIDGAELARCKLHLRRTMGALLALEHALERDAQGVAHG